MSQISCFVMNCTRKFELAATYVDHLLHDHRVPRGYRFPCTFHGCQSVFSKFCSYKRHVLNHNIGLDAAERSNAQPLGPPGNELVPSKSSNNERIDCDETIHGESSDNQSVEGADEAVESLAAVDTACINFTLDLHRRNNLTRTDVRTIQDSTQQLYS